MSENEKEDSTLQLPGNTGGMLVNAQGQPIAPPVDEDLKLEVGRALKDPYVRKLLTTIVTAYQLYAAARELLESDQTYSAEAKQGLIAATFHDLFDPQTKLCRPFQFPEVRKRLKDAVLPFTVRMQSVFNARHRSMQQAVFDADVAMREKPIPFFKGSGDIQELQRGEIYVMWVASEDADQVLERIGQWSVKASFGMLWLSRHTGDSEEFEALLKKTNNEVNIAPVDASTSTYGTRRNAILNIPMMHLYVADGLHVLGKDPDEKALSRFKEGLEKKKAVAIVVLREGECWPSKLGFTVDGTLSRDPDAEVEDSITVSGRYCCE